MKKNFRDFPLLESKKKYISLFYPHVSKKSFNSVKKVLSSRWIGQGPLVDKFEEDFSKKFCNKMPSVAVGSGTDALHLAYILANIKENDEVICPVFTCTATNIPLLYLKAKIKFADINLNDLNISIEHVEKLITKKTKAIVFVNYGGLLCNLEKLQKIAKKYKIPLIQDAAQSLGAKINGKEITEFADFTIFSFQAIKHITSGDGGALVCRNKNLAKKAKIIRWFGIDRPKKQGGTWENDIVDVGYKYQMTDIGAALLLDSMEEFKFIKKKRNQIHDIYKKELINVPGLACLKNNNKKHKPVIWLTTIICDRKDFLQKKLRTKLIETNQVHFRNDRYSIFKKFCKGKKFPNMDKIENKYLVIPTHTKMSNEDALVVANNIKSILSE
jgi:perosamine synthetase